MPRRYWLMECEPADYSIDPDHSAWTKGHEYFDTASSGDAPVGCMVNVGFVERFPATLPPDGLKSTTGLESMMVTRVQPATRAEYDIVTRIGRRTGSTP